MGVITRALCRWSVRNQLAPCLADGVSIPWARRRVEHSSRLSFALPGTRVEETRISGLPAAWVRAREVPDDADSAVLYFHGGGFATGSYRSHRGLASRLSAACGAPFLLPEYRLVPEHPHPAPDDDCLAAYRALLEESWRPERILLAGDSAGGFLALQTLLAARDVGLPLPRAAVLLSPLADASHLDGDSYTSRRALDVFLDPDGIRYLTGLYGAGADTSGDALSPLRRDLSGLPPLLVQVGDHEILLSDSVRLVERAREAGVQASLSVWPEMWHVFQLFAVIDPDAARAVQEIGRFARQQLDASESGDRL